MIWLVACTLYHGPVVPCEDGEAVFAWRGTAEVRELVVEVREPGHAWVKVDDYDIDGNYIAVQCDDGDEARVSFWGDASQQGD